MNTTDLDKQTEFVSAHSERVLPVHFFTIILNGEPFIRYHLDMMKSLPFPWHWHIIEGVASLVHDTAWSVASGGRVDQLFHDRGRSNDGTTAYLDEIAAAEPERVTLYRKPLDEFWDGKREMVSAPLPNIREECLLWQVDGDEIWRAPQIQAVRERFLEDAETSGAFFWCDYFVGPETLISTRYNYAQNPSQEWLRVWRYKPGDRWAAHEPPTLVRSQNGEDVNIAKIAPLTHGETEAIGAVFQHFAYVTEDQVRFKEIYYGYPDAVEHWRALQDAVPRRGTVFLKDYFPWVTDETLVDSVARLRVQAIAAIDPQTGRWRFRSEDECLQTETINATDKPRIVVDGVFFQHNQKSGIARVWRMLLTEWIASGFAQHILFLDRAGTAPRIPGLRTRSIPLWDQQKTGEDCFLLQKICDEERADLFVSSYYTTPISTPTLLVLYDMIPERLGIADNDQIWHEKHHAISHATASVCISEMTRKELLLLFPEVDPGSVSVALIGFDSFFKPASAGEIEGFRTKRRLSRPYFLLVGERVGYRGYKDGATLFRALGNWAGRDQIEVVCVGGASEIESSLQALAPSVRIHRTEASDEELRIAYSGALAFICTSRMEGFGIPILEAMACGAPVILARGSAMEEVGGEAALYFDPGDDSSLKAALDRVTDKATRDQFVAAGFERVRAFNWSSTAALYASSLLETHANLKQKRVLPPATVWRNLRAEQRRNQAALIQQKARMAQQQQQPLVLAPLAVLSTQITTLSAQPSVRGPLFAIRSFLLRYLPRSWIPGARRGWRLIMGIRVEPQN